MSLTLTLVRHGESTDNLKSLWAGHRDAPLTVHGMNQARRLGKSFQDVYITKIYASDLKRAHWTALQIATQNKCLLERLMEEDERQDAGDKGPPAGRERGEGEGKGRGEGGAPPHRTSSFIDTQEDDKDEERNRLTAEDPEGIATASAGPASLTTTDRVMMSGGHNGRISPLPPPESEYHDDLSCISSAAASSPMSGTSPSSSLSNDNYHPNGLDGIGSSRETRERARLAQTVTTTPLLREQFFGLAEGQNWKTGYATSNNSHHNRKYKFEKGESLEDVHARATEILERCVVPWLVQAWRTGMDEHLVLVAHGIMISELLFALARLQDPRATYTRQSGHTNTGWTRLRLTFPSNFDPSATSPDSASLPAPELPPLVSTALPPYYREPLANSKDDGSDGVEAGRFSPSAPSLPKITIRQTHTNHTDHLNGLKRAKGGIGSERFDERQSSLRNFFSGAASGATLCPEGSGERGSTPAKDSMAVRTPGVPDLPIDLTHEDQPKTGKARLDGDDEDGDGPSRRERIRVMSPPSPSPKKARMT